jgi:hypothetical protein
MDIKKFSPLMFLASLGAGGIAIMPFVLLQYTLEHGKGLITSSELWANNFTGLTAFYYYSLEAIMIIFSVLHVILTIWISIQFVKWVKTKSFKEVLHNPLKNSTLLAPLVSILMTMNVVIGSVRYFVPAMQTNFQEMMLPAFIVWLVLFVIVMWVEIKLLGISFKKGFDVDKANFGWLLHPLTLGMLTVVGTGISALAKSTEIANYAAFLSMISGSMGFFLLVVKMITLFKSHFAADKLPDKTFLPSLLIVIPNLTIYALRAFRFGHFLKVHHGMNVDVFVYLVVGFAFAFEIWYMIFAISLMKDYFKKHHFKEFFPTQWGFICPLVGFLVLGAITYHTVLQSPIIYGLLVISLILSVILYIELLIKQIKCLRNSKKIICE